MCTIGDAATGCYGVDCVKLSIISTTACSTSYGDVVDCTHLGFKSLNEAKAVAPRLTVAMVM